MSIEDMIWECPPHTAAKHLILKKYIEAWAPILSQKGFNPKIGYIDGFAGPGEYTGGEDGSPIVVLKALNHHQLKDNFKSQFLCLFVEKRNDRCKNLEKAISKKVGNLPNWITHQVVNGDFNTEIGSIMSDIEKDGNSLIPCLCFVDPFGWSDLNYDVLASFMKYNKAELFITFVAGYLSRFVWDPTHERSIGKLFSSEQMKIIKDAEDNIKREQVILQIFLENLINKIKVFVPSIELYNLSFKALNSNNRLEYYLIYLTKHCKGFQAMKSAMFNVSSNGDYKFSDFNFVPLQSTLIDYGLEPSWAEEAEREVLKYLEEEKARGLNQVPIIQVKNFIQCRTKWKYNTIILENLEKENKIIASIDKRKGQTFPARGYLSLP